MEHLPVIAGTLPQWGMFVALLVATIKLIPILRKQTLDADTEHSKTWRQECESLRGDLKAQQQRCDADNDSFRIEIKRLNEEIFGMRRQHITEQIELINVIMNSVNAPELRGMLKLLERVQAQVATREIVGAAYGYPTISEIE